MQDKAVLDSGVIASLFFREDGVSESAESILEKFDRYYTVDFAIAEITNVAWKKVSQQDEPEELIEEGLKKCVEFVTVVCEVIPSAELFDLAFKISVDKGITAYDALFVSASEKLNAPFITADRKLFKKLKNMNIILARAD